MSIICPTILAHTPAEFEAQIARLSPFAERVQIDLTDGDFAAPATLNLNQLYWPEGWAVDLHLMFRAPTQWTEALVALHPHLVIIHAEAEGDLPALVQHLQKFGIKTGVALLPDTSVDGARNLIKLCDHTLLFGGNLGAMGGTASLLGLAKLDKVLEINPKAEIGWDGGANLDNVAEIAAAGVDVINVGSAIAKAENPAEMYEKLTRLC
ncbi:MAG: hypothetical protein LBL08_02625 [Candidatus Nomurabacteria bacterium]|jgi:ribulose-phosphate 3-epimerase|nr:hypothetical protein [Candidatus Nomurabacteria bacterium]